MTEPVLRLEELGSVRRLTLNRPERLNALSFELVETLASALADAARDESCRALVIRGAGRAFCAGYDLKEEAEQRGWNETEREYSRIGLAELFERVVEKHGPIDETLLILDYSADRACLDALRQGYCRAGKQEHQ